MTAVLRHVWNCLKHNDLIANENVLKVEFDEEMDVLNGFVTRDLCKKNVLFESVASGNKTRREQKQNKTKKNHNHHHDHRKTKEAQKVNCRWFT